MRRLNWVFVWLLLIPLFGWSFGKNKLQYETHSWGFLDLGPVEVLLPMTLSMDVPGLSNEVISAYEALCGRFGYRPKVKVRLVLYPNSIDFVQGNIMDGLSPGTGGFTEFLHGRVVLPFQPDPAEFRHVLRHEMTHAFEGILWGGGKFSYWEMNDLEVPLWAVEGAAEYLSVASDDECALMVSDALENGTLPDLLTLSDPYRLKPSQYFLIYKEGELFYRYLEEKHPDVGFSNWMAAIPKYKRWPEMVSNTLGMSPERMNTEFMDYVRRLYYPAYAERNELELSASKISVPDSTVCLNPVWEGSNRIFFLTDRYHTPSIASCVPGKKGVELWVESGYREELKELAAGNHARLSVSTNGTLCFLARGGGRDVITFLDLKTRGIRSYPLAFRVVESPQISPDAKKVVFSAESNGWLDLYLFTPDDGKVIRLTSDDAVDRSPCFMPDGKILYTSNRRHGKDSADLDLCVLDPESGWVEWVLDTGAPDESPSVSADGQRIVFIQGGKHPSLWIFDRFSGKLFREISPAGACLSPQFTPDGDIVFSGFRNSSYELYRYTPRYASVKLPLFEGPLHESVQEEKTNFEAPSLRPYVPEFAIDTLMGGVMVNSSLGFGALGMLQFGDWLGNHRFQLILDTSFVNSSAFWRTFNADLIYQNREGVHPWGFHIYHYSNPLLEWVTFPEFYNTSPRYYTSYGGDFEYRIPFSTYDRLEAHAAYAGFSHVTGIITNGTNLEVALASESRPTLSISWVHDSTLSDITGPVHGIRWQAGISQCLPIFADAGAFGRFLADFRAYWLMFPGYSLAFRGVASYVWNDPDGKSPLYLGGFNTVRGYDLCQFSGHALFLCNLEFRFPLIADWIIGFPLPVRMPTVWGVIFCDLGAVTDTPESFRAFSETNDVLYFDGIRSGVGVGIRLVLMPGLKFMVDWAAPYNGANFPDWTLWRSFWQIGFDI